MTRPPEQGRLSFRALGPVEVEIDGCKMKLARRRDRGVLAVLMYECRRPVALDRFVRLLWSDGTEPASPRRDVQIHIARLRSLLSGARSATIRSTGTGYVLDTDPALIDIHQFSALVRQARTVWDLERKAALLRQAIDLWRGPALGDSAVGPLAATFGRELDELRQTAVEEWYEIELQLGRHQEHYAELSRLACEHPERTCLVRLAMLALYRQERTVEALSLYAHCRQFIVDQFGLEPDESVSRLHRAILCNDGAVLWSDAAGAPGGTLARSGDRPDRG